MPRPAEDRRAVEIPIHSLSEAIAVVDRDGRLTPRNQGMRELLEEFGVDRLEQLPAAGDVVGRLTAGEVVSIATDHGPHGLRLVVEGDRRWLLALGDCDRQRAIAPWLQWRRARVLGRIAGSVLHDLANLLLSGIGVAESLRPTLGDEEEAEAIEVMAAGVKEGAVLCRALARQLEVDAGSWQVVPLSTIVDDVVAIVRKNVQHRGVAMRACSAGDFAVRVDVAEAVQAVVHLLLFALAGGVKELELRTGQDRMAMGDDRWRALARLEVTCRGVDEERAARARAILVGPNVGLRSAASLGAECTDLLVAAIAIGRAGGELVAIGDGDELRFLVDWPDVSSRARR